VFVTAEPLLAEKRKLHSNVHLVENAADVTYFGQVQSTGTDVADLVKKLPRPVVGYLGTIHRHTDIELLHHIAQSRPEWSILVVGPQMDTELLRSSLFQRFRELPNTHLTGWMATDEVPGYFKGVDVCVIPYRTDSEFNRYVNPNKLHEYTAMGKPVVSTDIPCVHSHADIIYIAGTREEFVDCIEQALADDGPDRIAQRLRRAQENSWERRAGRVLKIVSETLKK